MTHSYDPSMTLDPPGTIAVVGAGPLGIEAALYARYLGYDVTVFESDSVGHSLRRLEDEPLPMLPNRCLSPLAISALQAQTESQSDMVLPMSCREWIEQTLVPLSQSDLLAGRVQVPAPVMRIATVAIETDGDSESEGDSEGEGDSESEGESEGEPEEIPADFRLHLESGETVDVESVITATGGSPPVTLEFETPAPYFFQIGEKVGGSAEADLRNGLKQIVEIFATLAGRADLDLYRPKRG